MEKTELVDLLTPAGLTLLDGIDPEALAADPVATVASLRQAGHSASLVQAVLTQARLRQKATAKFGEFARRMLFTQAGWEQATRLRVAALHAGRFQAAGVRSVADLGCGIGGDAMALAALDFEVTAVEADEVTAAIASYNLAPFPSARVEHGDAAAFDVDAVDAVFFDPARRTSGHQNTSRLTRPSDFSPSLDLVFGVASRVPTGVKLGPGFNRELIPSDAEAQWISVDGQVVEMGLWFGSLARPGVRRAALLLSGAGVHELVAEADSDDAEVRPLGAFLFEPDGAVIRARLIGRVASELGAGMLSEGIAYLTGDEPAASPFVSTFRVLEQWPLDEKRIKRELRERGIGTVEIKKRGVDVDPAALRKRLAPKGRGQATLVLTRVAGRHTALLVERVAAPHAASAGAGDGATAGSR